MLLQAGTEEGSRDTQTRVRIFQGRASLPGENRLKQYLKNKPLFLSWLLITGEMMKKRAK